MIQISDTAQTYFRKLIEREAVPGMGVRLSAVDAGTPRADARLRRDHPLGRQRLHRLAQNGPRYLEPFHQLGVAGQDFTDLEHARNDIKTEPVHDLCMIGAQLAKTDRCVKHSSLQE